MWRKNEGALADDSGKRVVLPLPRSRATRAARNHLWEKNMTDDPVLHALVDLVRAVECYPSPPMNGPAYKNALAVIRERTGMQPEATYITLATEKGLTPIGEVVAALQELSNMYAHTWDRTDGALTMMGVSIPRFEAAHERATKALEAFARPQRGEG